MMTVDGFNVDFTDQEEETLFAQAKLGMDAAVFFNSDMGRYLKGCALQDIKECAVALLDAQHNDEKEIVRLQMKAMTARNFVNWVNEAIENGNMAHEQLVLKNIEE